MRRALTLLAAAVTLCGCPSRGGRRVERFEGQNVRALRRLAVAPFSDPRGQGRALARAVTAGLAPILHESAEEIVVDRALASRNKEGEAGLGFESLEILRHQGGADGLVLGRMAPDWSSVSVTIHETELGDPALRAVLVPRGKNRKSFKDAAEVASEVLRLISEGR